jgi:CheY-like chemotaxis protein
MRNDSLNDEKSVMVVDDDTSVRESMSRLLEAKGYSVLQADNGQTALDLLKKEPHFPCLVILDLAMPIMDGRRFLEIRAEDPILRDIPVVVVSGNPPPPKQPKGNRGLPDKAGERRSFDRRHKAQVRLRLKALGGCACKTLKCYAAGLL